MWLARPLILGAILTLPLETADGCVLDHAEITAVKPHTFQVIETRQCHPDNRLCWFRYSIIDGVRREHGVACEDGKQPSGLAVPRVP